jgi:hypothetical protein
MAKRKLMLIQRRRFASITVLTKETPVLGATAKEWDEALTGNMQQSLDELKAQLETTQSRSNPERDR